MKKMKVNGFELKVVAAGTMFLDHVGAVVLENGLLPTLSGTDLQFWSNVDAVLRLIGRLAFPLYCFLLVEGFLHTRSVKKYALRLLLFALFSEFPFDLALFHGMDMHRQNVFFTLFIALLVLQCFGVAGKLPVWLRIPTDAAVLVAGVALAELLRTDYAGFGVILIALLYVARENRFHQFFVGVVATLWELTAPVAYVLTYFYIGERGKQLPKYFFYAFYPVHLLVLVLFREVFLCC